MSQNDRLYEAQVGVLGSMLLDDRVVGEVLTRVRDEDFVIPQYRSIYAAIREAFTAGEGVDMIVVLSKLRALDGYEQYRRLLAGIMETVPSAAQCSTYVDIMLEESKLYRARELLDLEQFPATIADLRELLDKINGITADRPGLRMLTMVDGLALFLGSQNPENKRDYLTWGFTDLDLALFAERGDFIVLGGYPSAGKTALALQFACHISKAKRVGFFSLETRDVKLFERLVAHITKVALPKIKRTELEQDDWDAITALSTRITEQKLEIIEAAGMTVQEIQAVALSRRYDVIFVDYLQLIPSTGYNRTEEVTRTSLALHTMAQRTGTTIVALSQLSRPERKGEGKVAPTMSSLRESGQIEQDADIVMLLYLDKPDDNRSARWLKVSKNKEGEKTKMLLEFQGAVQTFRQSYRQLTATASAKKAAGAEGTEVGTQLALLSGPNDDSDLPF